MKHSAVVVIGVDRRGVGRDNGISRYLPYSRRDICELWLAVFLELA
jgi:hypothetical protein